jgi:hypothetical protein
MRQRRVRLILPALAEATSRYWRPIEYSLFPPLGLATLAGFLDPDDEVILIDEHVQRLDLDDRPDLVLIQGYITNAYRAYRIADHYRAKGVFVAMARSPEARGAQRGVRLGLPRVLSVVIHRTGLEVAWHGQASGQALPLRLGLEEIRVALEFRDSSEAAGLYDAAARGCTVEGLAIEVRGIVAALA